MQPFREFMRPLNNTQFAILVVALAFAVIIGFIHWILIEIAVRRGTADVPTAVKIGCWHYGMLRESYYENPGRVYAWIVYTFVASIAAYILAFIMLLRWWWR